MFELTLPFRLIREIIRNDTFLFTAGQANGDIVGDFTGNGALSGDQLIFSGYGAGATFALRTRHIIELFAVREQGNSLLKTKFTIGADASVAAGPVGRQAGASTDASLNAQILSYSRSKGLFAGLELKGVVITQDDSDMRDAYGSGTSAKDILRENKVNAPASIRAFPNTLARYSTRKSDK